MNYRDKIQKFSIRKYTVGTFSTVIATLVFLGLNTSQAQAAETNQPASALKQKQQNGDTQTENREVEVQNSQNGQSLSAPIENEQPNNNQTNHVDASAVQSSTTEHDQPVSQNEQAKKDTAAATPTQSAKAASKHEQSESRAANKKENDNKATHVESHEANVVTASDSSDSGNVQHDRNELQAFFDANYHDYRFIDRENADSGTFNYVKGIFDKINTLLGSNDPINNKDLQLAYKELEQEGYLYSKSGLGTYVSATDKATQLRADELIHEFDDIVMELVYLATPPDILKSRIDKIGERGNK